MEPNKNNWNLGELVTLPKQERPLKSGAMTQYGHYIGSRYICIREATDTQRGILVKVLGKCPPEFVSVVGGQPFTKDDREELFNGCHYFSYPYPASKDVKEVLDILDSTPTLLQYFQNASMHINPKSSFWLRETTKKFFFIEKPQCYDVSTDSLSTGMDDPAPYRVTMVYFSKDKSISVR